LVYADDVNRLGDNLDTIKKNKNVLTDASKGSDLEANAGNTKYIYINITQYKVIT
jgi:hypothetical protein